jgi:hypothetical protein
VGDVGAFFTLMFSLRHKHFAQNEGAAEMARRPSTSVLVEGATAIGKSPRHADDRTWIVDASE